MMLRSMLQYALIADANMLWLLLLLVP